MALDQGTLVHLTLAMSNANEVVQALIGPQQQIGRPLSPSQVQTLQFHLEVCVCVFVQHAKDGLYIHMCGFQRSLMCVWMVCIHVCSFERRLSTCKGILASSALYVCA